jgi:urease accessory protein
MADVEDRPTMLEAHEVAEGGAPTDRLALTWEARRRSRQKASTESGRQIGLFLPRGTILPAGSLLRADDGTIIEVVAAPEDVSTISTPDAVLLARVAYQLGNRHVRTQVGPGFIRYRHDRAIDELVRKLGAEVVLEEVPFEPERDTEHRAHDHDLAS